MGLLFLMPTRENEINNVEKTQHGVVVRSYPLPFLFWCHLIAIFMVLMFLLIGIWAPMTKMMQSQDMINIVLSWSVLLLFILIPLVLIGIFFYEKSVVRIQQNMSIIHRILGIDFRKRDYVLSADKNPFVVEHYLGTPNMAKMEQNQQYRAFQNQGYYILFFFDIEGRKIFLDRNSRKADLKQLATLLSSR